MIKEFLNTYLILPHVDIVIRVLLIPFITLGIIYGLGRLLEIIHGYKTKNRLAFLLIIILSYFTGNFLELNKSFIIDVITVSSLSNIIYVTICWKLYYRVENLLDKTIAPDDGFEEETKKKKKRKKKK